MNTIWKYELEITDEQIVSMDADAAVVAVAEQNGILCLWALLDSEHDPVDHTILVRGTGHALGWEIKDPVDFGDVPLHLGSVVTRDGFLVWHVFSTSLSRHV